MRQVISCRRQTSQRIADLNNRYMSSKHELPPVKLEYPEEFKQRIKEERKEANERRRKEKLQKMIDNKRWKEISNDYYLTDTLVCDIIMITKWGWVRYW